MARRSNQPSRPVKIVDILLWVGIVLGLAGVFGIEENEGKVFFGVIGVAALLLYIRRVSRKQTALESTNQQTSPVAPYNQQNKMNAPTGSNQVALDTREVLPKFGLTKYETGIKELCNAARTAFIAFDFETTGLKSEIHCITEIGAIKYENGIETARFHSLINPKQPIPDEVSRITGITDAMVSNAPLVETVLPSFLSFINGYLLVAHNASFDLAFLAPSFFLCFYYISTIRLMSTPKIDIFVKNKKKTKEKNRPSRSGSNDTGFSVWFYPPRCLPECLAILKSAHTPSCSPTRLKGRCPAGSVNPPPRTAARISAWPPASRQQPQQTP